MENYEPKKFIDRTIARAMGKNKTLDAQCNLSVPKDRAQSPYLFHSEGGKDENPVSSIRLNLTDYSGGSKATGGQSTYVGYNLPPAMFSMLKEVASKNLTTPTYPIKEGLWGVLYKSQTFMTCVLGTLNGVLQIALSFFRGIVSGKKMEDICTSAGKSLKALCGDLANIQANEANTDGNAPNVLPLLLGHDYSYVSEKVNAHRTNEQGMVAVSKISITCTNRAANGEVQKYPWTIQIQNFWARPRYNQNGTVTYDGQSATDTKSAYIKLGNENMYSFCWSVENFVTVWEFMIHGGMVLSAETERFNTYNN